MELRDMDEVMAGLVYVLHKTDDTQHQINVTVYKNHLGKF